MSAPPDDVVDHPRPIVCTCGHPVGRHNDS